MASAAAAVAAGVTMGVAGHGPFSPAQAEAFGTPVHKALTRELGFLRPVLVQSMVDGNLAADQGWGDEIDSSLHFDDCDFSGGTGNLDATYRHRVIAPLVGSWSPHGHGAVAAARGFGRMLHGAQDFYAHSNWTELGRTDLLDGSVQPWRVLRGWQVVRGDVVAGEGEGLPDGWRHPRSSRLPVPHVDTPNGRFRVLISGSAGSGWLAGFNNDKCHDEMTLSHEDLNKDSPTAGAAHLAARDLASRQTRHEWCRMLHLLSDRGGPAGAAEPITLWPRSKASPHPAGTPCAEAGDGVVGWAATVTGVRVKRDGDDDSAGELNYVLGLYGDDLRRSVRSEANQGLPVSDGGTVPASRLPAPVSACFPAGVRPVVTLQAWDDDDDGGDGVLDADGGDHDDIRKGVAVTPTGSTSAAVSSEDLDVRVEVRRSRCVPGGHTDPAGDGSLVIDAP